MNNQNGFALPVVLLMSGVILLLVTGLAFHSRSKTRIALEVKSRTQARLKAHSAMNTALYMIGVSYFRSTSLLAPLEPPMDDGGFASWNIFGKPFELEPGVTVSLQDTSGLASLSSGSSHLLRKLLQAKAQAGADGNALMDSLLDWQDPDEFKRPNGAERFTYITMKRTYTPRNAMLQTPEEMLLIKGFNRETFEAIRNDITDYPYFSMNLLTASNALLRIYAGDKNTADNIIELRENGVLTPALLRNILNLPHSEQYHFSPNGALRVNVTATVNECTEHIEALVIKRETQQHPVLVQHWRQ